MNKQRLFIALVVIPGFIVLAALLYNYPPINERLAWRIDSWKAQVKYALNPPEEALFIPEGGGDTGLTPSATPSPTLVPVSPTPSPVGPTETLLPSLTPTTTSTPIPESVVLDGIIHQVQSWNNCGPANLSMALSYWKWNGDQRDTAAYLKPNSRDKNVSPYEMVAYVNEETEFNALWRVGGDVEMLKRLIAAGFPVLIEKGFEGTGFEGWMGHYEVINGYNDAEQYFVVQDSFISKNLHFSYEDVLRRWQHFNYVYLVIYYPAREAEVMELLGPHADTIYNYQAAAAKASDEIYTLEGRARAFAWYNYGTNLVYLDDYAGAAQAYDEYFALTKTLNPEEVNVPWRNLWYQTGPYWAYFYTQRYYDVLALATTTIDTASEPAIEESWYWRALAREALGDIDGAIADLQEAVKLNENFGVGWYQLERIQGGG